MMRRAFLWAAVGALGAACAGPAPFPGVSPSPSAAPSPGPEPLAPFDPPLGVAAGRFVDAAGRDARLMGLLPCCYFVDFTNLRRESFDRWTSLRAMVAEASAAGFNYLEMRFGPYWISDCCDRDMSVLRAYAKAPDGRADLGHWDDAYWAKRVKDAETAREFRMYYLLDAVDCWQMKPAYFGLSPWARANNVQGFDGSGQGIVARAPHAHAEALIRKEVLELGRFDHTAWQVGNECNLIGVSQEWERGVVAIIRDEERRRGYIRHLVGTNSERANPDWADFESFHTHDLPPSRLRRPSQVNEFNPAMPAAEWGGKARTMMARGGAFHFWLSDSDDENIANALAEARRIRQEQSSAPRSGRPRSGARSSLRLW